MKKRNIWIIIALLAAILAVVLILIIVHNHKPFNENQSGTVVEDPTKETTKPDSNNIIEDEDYVYSSDAKSVVLNNKGHIVLTLEDGSKLDQGYFGGKIEAGSHLVVFVNLDNTILKVVIVKDGHSAEPPEYPGIEGYEFNGWRGDYNSVTEDTIVYATYIKLGFYHTVTFCDDKGQVISSEKVRAGANAIGPNFVPEREGFVFSGWDKSVMNVLNNITVSPTYVQAENPMFVVDSVSAKPGDTAVKVKVRLMNNPGICSSKLSISYGSGLSLVSYEFGDNLEGTSIGPESLPQTGQGVFLWYQYDADLMEDSDFLTLTFNVAEDAQGIQEITLNNDPEDMFNQGGEDIGFDLVNGAIRVID